MMPNSYWKEHQITILIDIFQEGQLVIKANNQIAGVDIDLLRELNQFGSVRNLRDRRKDIYDLIRK